MSNHSVLIVVNHVLLTGTVQEFEPCFIFTLYMQA